MENLKLNLLVVMAMVVVSMEFHCTLAKEHIVGGPFGWNVPNNKYFVNDVLVFNFPTGVHNAAVVSLSAHDRCDGSEVYQMYPNSPATVPLNLPGLYCFISTIGSDCQAFMKMIVKVGDSANTTVSVLPH
ncbi:putative Phytocyanin domain, cupredoxin [Helianthus annuus]|nr:putative Phytocyanin domain, cupredoxin [Helianthus annuus]KAJ0788595.1 putative Phytocyanin domain, cupredoxin [Helianthus annuus]